MESYSPLSKMVHFYHSTTYRTKMYPMYLYSMVSISYIVSLQTPESQTFPKKMNHIEKSFESRILFFHRECLF